MNEVEEDLSNCPYCNAEISANSAETLLVDCLNPNCNDVIEFNEHSCESCGVSFSEQDWDLFVSSASPHIIEKIKDYYAADDPIMLCCSNRFLDCKCDRPISWDDIMEIPQSTWETAYGSIDNNDCFTCNFQYTELCKPLCDFVVNYITDYNSLTQISVCGDYSPDEFVADNLNQQKSSEYIYINYEEF